MKTCCCQCACRYDCQLVSVRLSVRVSTRDLRSAGIGHEHEYKTWPGGKSACALRWAGHKKELNMESISSEVDSILREEIELAKKDDPGLIVRSAFNVIEDYLGQGMSLERIALALRKHGFKVTKGHLVRHLGIIREERGLEPLKRGVKPKKTNLVSQAVNQEVGELSEPGNDESPAVHIPLVLDKPSTMDQYRANQKKIGEEAKRISGNTTVFPEEISKLKFIEVKGEQLDVTKMNIDDYLNVSKTMRDGEKVPDGMFEIIAAENKIRGMYERALVQYNEAIVRWKSNQ